MTYIKEDSGYGQNGTLNLSPPEVLWPNVFIVATRVALFSGIAFLLALRLRPLYLRYKGRKRRSRG